MQPWRLGPGVQISVPPVSRTRGLHRKKRIRCRPARILPASNKALSMNFQLVKTDRAAAAGTHSWATAGSSPVAARVERALHGSGYVSLRNLDVSANRSIVRLRGRVSTYHLKQLAQAAALSVPGVREVRNEVEVVSTR